MFALIIALLSIVGVLLTTTDLSFARFTDNYTNVSILSGVSQGSSNAFYNEVLLSSAICYIASIGVILFIAGCALSAVFALVRLFTGKVCVTSLILGIVTALGAILATVGLAIGNLLVFTVYGWIIALVIGILVAILAIVGYVGNKPKKVKIQK